MNYDTLLQLAITAAIEAGTEILKIYSTNFFVETKNDNTPVTLADKAASKSIVNLLAITNIPVISEEEEILNYDTRKNWQQVWVIDPLDGTKEFVKRNGEFTVNIALIDNKLPVIGVIFSPVSNILYFAAKNMGAYKIINQSPIKKTNTLDFMKNIMSIATRIPSQKLPKNYTIVASRSHLNKDINQYIEKLKNMYGTIDIIYVGSSIKQCWVADGFAHEYLRLGTTMEWDTAAGQCILEQAGCFLIDLETNQAMQYNKHSLKNNFFIAKH